STAPWLQLLLPPTELLLRGFAWARWGGKHARKLLSDGPTQGGDGATRALFVTAHPDDEAMFFAPTILCLARAELWLLCGSTGNYYHQGDIRKKELLESCMALGIPLSHVTIVDHSKTHAPVLGSRVIAVVFSVKEGKRELPAALPSLAEVWGSK
uniref:N-acetylglucosaminylphosphatidylinositol deacetylase n=1 Tax=Varanus komodoensis TaxID=61221 RepID=A0A8D2LER9_VARKO